MMTRIKSRRRYLLCMFIFLYIISIKANSADEFESLHHAYPESIQAISPKYITWNDGSRMLIRGLIPLFDYLMAPHYQVDLSLGSISRDDIKNDSLEPFFRKMYGNNANEVKKKLVTIYWMPKIYGKKYPLKVTTVNGVHKKLQRVSAELEKLPSDFHKYVENPASSYYWRNVAREKYLSLHSFGIAIDINLSYSNYWMWDLEKSKKIGVAFFKYQNRIPMEIVEIFEKEGFAWGGRWYHYDTMHFEYRPELFV